MYNFGYTSHVIPSNQDIKWINLQINHCKKKWKKCACTVVALLLSLLKSQGTFLVFLL